MQTPVTSIYQPMNTHSTPLIPVAQTIQNIIHDALISLDITIDKQDIHLEHPNLDTHGDYTTNIAMTLIKQTEDFSNPRQFAQAITNQIQNTKHKILDTITVAGPGFINFSLSTDFFTKELTTIIKQQDNYGSTQWGKGETWLIEHTSPNPNKSMHLGHLRNNVTGMAISNLWEATGIRVIRDCIDNNRGIAIAKLMWGYLKFAHQDNKHITDINYWYKHQNEWLTPEDVNKTPDKFMDELYVQASNDFKNSTIEDQVRQFVVDWEAENKETWALWETVLKYVYQGQNKTLKRLGNKWDKVWHEHEHYKQGKQFVEQGLKTGVFKKLDDGAILTNLQKEFSIPDTIVQKKDGTSLYITQDIALTKLKKETFKADKMHWIIGPEQSLAMKQVFAVCDQLGIIKYDNCIHIAYGYMSIKGQGKMSSREGNVIYIDDLIDQTKEEIRKILDEEKIGSDSLNQTSETIALGAIKYSILKTGRLTNTSFDIQSSIDIHGNSGPYLQYTHARCHSVLIKAQEQNIQDTKYKIQNTKYSLEELAVLKYLYRFPEVVTHAAQEYAPNHVCTYLYELAQRYNTFYNKHSVLNAQDDQIKAFRLQLTQATMHTLKNGLSLLGIKAPQKM